MNRIRWYGPSVVFLIAAVLAVVGGPRLVEQLVWAQADAQIRVVRNSLTQNVSLAELSDAFQKVAQVVEPSVVHIQISSKQGNNKPKRFDTDDEDLLRRFFGPEHFRFDPHGRFDGDDPEQDDADDLRRYNVPRVIGNGSGWVYDDRGHIITNYHVVKDADEITVRFHDGEEARATVVGVDPKTDIAVMKVDSGGLHPSILATRPVEQGNIVLAFGSPFGFEFSMSQGIVSAKGRRLGIITAEGGYENFIQTDAAINRGNSGGPLTNIYGEVVGMNTAIATRSTGFQGLGFAIPVAMVRNVVDQIILSGRVSRGYLGIYITDLNPKLAKTFGYDGAGVLVEDPINGSPAQEAGLKRGDIIVKLNGKPVVRADDLRHIVATFTPDTKLTLEVFRNGQTKVFEVTTGELPERTASVNGLKDKGISKGASDEKDKLLLRKLGFDSVATFTKEQADKFGMEFKPGVLVRAVRPDSAADAGSMRAGQVVTSVMGVAVAAVDELVAELKKHDLTQGVRLSVSDGDLERFVLLELPD